MKGFCTIRAFTKFCFGLAALVSSLAVNKTSMRNPDNATALRGTTSTPMLALVPTFAAPSMKKLPAVNTTCTTTHILAELAPLNVTPGSYVVGGGLRGWWGDWKVSFDKGFHVNTPFGGGSITSGGFDFQVGPDGFPVAKIGVGFDEGFNLETEFLSAGFEVGVGDQGFSIGAEVLGAGFDATIGEPPLELQLEGHVASAGLRIGADGFDLNGDIDAFGLAGASFEAGCGPTCNPCCGEGNAWVDEKCADFWKDLANGGLFQSLRNFRMPQIGLPSVVMKTIFEQFKERVQQFLGIAKSFPNCYNTAVAPDKMLECIEKSEDGKNAIKTLLAGACSSLFSGDDVLGVLTSLAIEQLARLKSFGDSCLAQICVGDFCFDQLMAWTKAFTLSLEFGLSGIMAGGVEFGVAIGFSDDSAKVTNIGCFVGGSSGVSPDAGVDAGISAALWRDYSQIPGYSITVSGEVDLCDMLIPGCPVSLELAAGMISTYANPTERERLIGQVQSCLKSIAPWAPIIGIPDPDFEGCFGAASEFIQKTNGIAIPIAPIIGVDVNIVPLAFEVMTDYTIIEEIDCDNDHLCEKATDVITLVGSSAALKRDVEIGEMCVGPRVLEVTNGAGQSFCLSDASGNSLVLGDCDFSAIDRRQSPETQLWTIEADMVRLSGPSQLCMALPNATTAGNGARVVTRSCDSKDADQKWQTLTSGQIRSRSARLCIDAGINQKKSVGDDVYVWACMDRSASAPAHTENVEGVGGWGGACTCPNSGMVYWVGDLQQGCDSLACYGGVAGKCHEYHNELWSGKQVICDGVFYNQAIIPHLVQQWSFNLQSLIYSTKIQLDVGPSPNYVNEVYCDHCKKCQAIPQWDGPLYPDQFCVGGIASSANTPRGDLSTSLDECKSFCEDEHTCVFITYYEGADGCYSHDCLVDGHPSRCRLSTQCDARHATGYAPTAVYKRETFRFIENSSSVKVIRYDEAAGWKQDLKVTCEMDAQSLCLRADKFIDGADVSLASCDEQDSQQAWLRGGLLIQPRDKPDLCLTAKSVSCGGHFAQTCAQCPSGHGAAWCNGQCTWSSDRGECIPNDSVQRHNALSLMQCTAPNQILNPGGVWCGGHGADSCAECPKCGDSWCGSAWCNGDCVWNEPLAGEQGQCIAQARNQLWAMSSSNQIFQEDFSNQAIAKLGPNDVGFTESATTVIVNVGSFDGSSTYKTAPCDHCGGCTILGENVIKHTFHFGYTDSLVAVAQTDAAPGIGWDERLALRCHSESAGLCPYLANSGVDCGYHGITQDECEARGCCWDPTSPSKWCYPKGKDIEAQRFTMKMHCVHQEESPAGILEAFVWAKN